MAPPAMSLIVLCKVLINANGEPGQEIPRGQNEEKSANVFVGLSDARIYMTSFNPHNPILQMRKTKSQRAK